MKDRDVKLLFVKIIHTLIWLFMVCVIGFVMWSGITHNISVASWIAVAIVFGEGLVLAMFKGRCPLTNIARNYSVSTKANFDIFLPNWLARYNKPIFITLFIIGLSLMLFTH